MQRTRLALEESHENLRQNLRQTEKMALVGKLAAGVAHSIRNPLTGLNFQGTGTLATPLGAKLLRPSAMPAGKIIGLDKNYALERICGSEVLVEYDKLIDRQRRCCPYSKK